MAETQIIITECHQNPKTGHITITVKSHTVDGNSEWDGPEVDYGVDVLAFRSRFNSDLAQFEQYIANQHKVYIGANPALEQALQERKGKAIG